ncbi:hypothetical protein ACFPA8_07060 [Streptomyces ovatisporus]|uniref:Integral membrane protein n=1 Tax=Streptomyces ovatisporus TaxID=1128682 RepID=A0ABV9A5T3_9ACTN
MAANPYPHLGWNPVPGVPQEVDRLRQKVTSAASSLRSCHNQIEKLLGESSYWEGDAAEKFRETLDGDLPTYVKNAARSLEKASAQLKKWDGELTSNRDLARKYDDEAGEKQSAAKKAKAQVETAGKHPDLKLGGKNYPSQEEADAATERLRAAERELASAQASLTKANESYDDVIAKARKLEAQHETEAKAVAEKLNDATDKLAPKSPLTKILESIWNGIKDAGQFLLDHAGTIGAIAGLLALFPTPLTPLFAGIAIAASAASMAKNVTHPEFQDQLLGKGSGMDTFSAYASLAGDFVGMVPGGKVLATAGREAALAIRTADEAGEVVSRTGTFTRELGTVLRSETSAQGAWDAAGESAKGSAKLMGSISANGLNVGANVISSLETEGKLPEDGAGHNAAETTKAAATAHSIAEMAGIL